MTQQEFYQWAAELILNCVQVYPGEYSNRPFCSGCYQDEERAWYYYRQIDERTSLTPSGQRMSEEECFEKLKGDVLYALEQMQLERQKELERVERMSLEKLLERQRIKQEQQEDEKILELFRAENTNAESVDEVVIDVEKIYALLDGTDECNSTYGDAKYTYESIYDEVTAVHFLKIYKYMDKLGTLIQKGHSSQTDLLILQKVGQIFAAMSMEADRKIMEVNK